MKQKRPFIVTTTEKERLESHFKFLQEQQKDSAEYRAYMTSCKFYVTQLNNYL